MTRFVKHSLLMPLLCISLSVLAANEADFVTACLEAGDIEQQVCECTANKAKDELSPLAFDFVVAALKKDDKTTKRLSAQLQPTELIPAGMFMVNGPARCANELAQ